MAFGALAIETLARRGRRSLLMVAPPGDMTYGQEMRAAAVAAAEAAGVALAFADATSDDPRPVISADVATRLAAEPGIDALIAASPHAAMVSVAPIEARGHVIGTDFDLFAKETFPLLEFFRDGILTVQEDIREAGRFLARAAVHEVRSGGGTPLQALDRPSDPSSG